MPAVSHTCAFCSEEVKSRIVMKQETVYVIEDRYPVTQGHLLIVPFYHTLDYYTMTDEERRDSQQLLTVLTEQIARRDPSVVGFNVGINCGESDDHALQHAHIHLIPLRAHHNLRNKPFSYLR